MKEVSIPTSKYAERIPVLGKKLREERIEGETAHERAMLGKVLQKASLLLPALGITEVTYTSQREVMRTFTSLDLATARKTKLSAHVYYDLQTGYKSFHLSDNFRDYVDAYAAGDTQNATYRECEIEQASPVHRNQRFKGGIERFGTNFGELGRISFAFNPDLNDVQKRSLMSDFLDATAIPNDKELDFSYQLGSDGLLRSTVPAWQNRDFIKFPKL